MLEQVLEKLSPEKIDVHPFCSAVIVAGGKGRRMESNINKVYMDIHGKKALIRTLEPFQQSCFIDEIVLVVNEKDVSYCGFDVINRAVFTKIKKIIAGGHERQDSVYNGLMEISDSAEFVLIHDGARPLVTEDIIERSIIGALEFGAVSIGMPVKDTIKLIDNEGFVLGTPDRKTLWTVQTPQVFKRDIIIEGHKKAAEIGIKATDDAVLVEKAGYKIKMLEGSYENIKLTTPEDLTIARAITAEREGNLE